MLRILHLSDFHYKINNDSDFKDIGEKIANSLQGHIIDFVVFSGDLVFNAEKVDDFIMAIECLIEPIKKVTKLGNDRFLFAPGNHDMHKGQEMPMVEKTLSSFHSNVEVDEFCNNQQQLKESIVNFKNYNTFITNFYKGIANVTPLYTLNIVNLRGKKIGLIAFNSAWRCKESKQDRGKLIYPVHMVREAFRQIIDCEIVICTQHHNISDYADFVAQDIEDIINEKCHVLFTGHYHKASVQTSFDTEIGLLHLIAPATYNVGEKFSNYGFNIFEFEEDTLEGSLITYFKHEDKFVEVSKKFVSVPVSEEKHKQNEFRRLLQKHYNETKEKTDALFVHGADKSFDLLFQNPIIKNKSVQEILATEKDGDTIGLDELLSKKESAIIFGQDKRGKTSLLRWLQLEALKISSLQKVIPYFIDAKLYRNSYRKGKRLDLKKSLHSYLEMNYSDLEKKFERFQLLLLIDDLNLSDGAFVNDIQNEMKKFPNCRFISTCAESMSEQCALINFVDVDLDKLYIHDITNKEIHQLTKSWPNIPIERKRIAEMKIIQIFSQMHISFNYWTVSLFLWIFEKTDPSNIHNNFELVKLYLDELLGKDEFINNRSFTTEYGDLKSYIGFIAEKSLQTEDYMLDEEQLLNLTYCYRNEHQKFSDSAMDIITYLTTKGIFQRNQNKYAIRLKGVFEFFLAYRMSENLELLDYVLCDKYTFLSFGNELEYYAGFRKNDIATIENIFKKAKDILVNITSHPEYEQVDQKLGKKIYIMDKDVQLTGDLIKRLSNISTEEQYEISLGCTKVIDDSEITPKTYFENININASIFERILFILSRIYRNSNVCDDRKLSSEIFDFVLMGACNMGYMVLDETKEYEQNSIDYNRTEKLIQLVSNCMPIIIETFLYDAICQKNLIRVFIAKLEELIRNPQNNQLRIFLLTYMLVDLDIKKHLGLINKVWDILSNKTLRYAMLNKNVLLTMRYGDDATITTLLRDQRKLLIEEFKGIDNLDASIKHRLISGKAQKSLTKRRIDDDYGVSK